MRKVCAHANMMYRRTESGFILEHNFASKFFAAVIGIFSNAYTDKEVESVRTIH